MNDTPTPTAPIQGPTANDLLNGLRRELTYQQKMSQQTEQDMITLAARAEKAEAQVKEERAEADKFQVQVLGLLRRELFLMKENAELKAKLTYHLFDPHHE